MTLGVRGLVTDQAGRVLLIQHTYVKGWHLPGGGVDRGEAAETAVIRELVEEVGIVATSRPRLLSVHNNHARFRGDHVLYYRIDSWEQGRATSVGEIDEDAIGSDEETGMELTAQNKSLLSMITKHYEKNDLDTKSRRNLLSDVEYESIGSEDE
jgi:ADP-ribose pyrophosphatase YjhB (NUDIX family)